MDTSEVQKAVGPTRCEKRKSSFSRSEERATPMRPCPQTVSEPVRSIPRDREHHSCTKQPAGFLTHGSSLQAAFPTGGQWPCRSTFAFRSPITVTRSHRNCTCFPFTLCAAQPAAGRGTGSFFIPLTGITAQAAPVLQFSLLYHAVRGNTMQNTAAGGARRNGKRPAASR